MPTPDPYQILGVSRTATQAEIKSAYRKLAKKLHPDVNPGRKDIEAKFKDVTAAYDLLSDQDKRDRFDRGEINAQGQEQGFGGGRGGYNPYSGGFSGFSGTRGGTSGAGGNGDPFSAFGGMEDIFAEFMGGGKNKKRGPGAGFGGNAGFDTGNIRGNDISYTISVPFVEACLGGKRRVGLANDKTLDVTIPAGIEDGYKLRLKGQGSAGLGGGAGDAIVIVSVTPHPFFSRKGNDILLELPVSLPEAILGASVTVPTLDGHVAVKVPKGANTGTTLRLKGKGVTGGDMMVKLKLVLPDTISSDLESFVEKWAKKHAYDPRKKAGIA
jgi:DnaJ-class molecular chaperone